MTEASCKNLIRIIKLTPKSYHLKSNIENDSEMLECSISRSVTISWSLVIVE